ncbi:MAG: transposase [Candidatus Brocadia sp. BROELEC01]|nr:MAG: transposase [Candidatus Brocadia sp. BROELEC01]
MRLTYSFTPAINCTCEFFHQPTTGAKDLSVFSANIPLLNTFLKNFASCFSSKQLAIFTLVIYALFKDYKRNSLEVMAKATHTDYQKLQYFFSDSKWDTQALKRIRLEIIQKQRTTAPAKDGLLAIDDTGCPKPFAKKTEGAKLQYCGPLKRKEVCNVGVGAAFVSDSKHFPIDIIPYLPVKEFPRGKNNSQFKDKIQIALELFDLYAESFALSGIVFDSWYATTRFLTHIHKEGKIFYSEIKSNRNIFMRHPVKKNQCLVKPDVLSYRRRIVTIIKKHFWDKIKFVKFKTTDGSEVSHKTYSFEAKLNDCDVPIKFVIIFGKWNKDDDYTYHILVTNNLYSSTSALSKSKKLAHGYFKIKSKRLKTKYAA